MHCKHCEARPVERTGRPRRPRGRRAGTCERCGAPITPTLEGSPETGAQLTRFGLAITGAPLLELKREGI